MNGLIPWKTPSSFSVQDLVEAAANNPPDFAHHVIEKLDDEYFQQLRPFVLEHRWDSNATIDVSRIVGTIYSNHYARTTWLDFLRIGKRMQFNLGLYIDNPSYLYLV